MSEIDDIKIKLELVFKWKSTQSLKRILLLLITLLTLQILDVHYFYLTALRSAVFYVCNILARSMPPNTCFFEPFCAKN
jgi:hypothetical protein